MTDIETAAIPDATLPITYDCRRNRHTVVGEKAPGIPDDICVRCGARNVVDARKLPPVPVLTAGADPIDTGPDDRVRRIAHRLMVDQPYRQNLARILATEPDGGAAIIREILRRIDTK